MEFAELVSRCRSYRRFDGQHAIGAETLRALVSLARCAPSAANRQPLRFVLSCEAASNARIFETLAWAAYLKEWPGPEPRERPTAYIVILLDRTISQGADTDVGIAAQTMLLGATALGLGGCMFGAIRREELAARLRPGGAILHPARAGHRQAGGAGGAGRPSRGRLHPLLP